MGDINTFVIDFGNSVPATATLNEDGTLSIFLNARLNREQREKAFNHELRHYTNNDFHSDLSVDYMEVMNEH